MGRAALGALEFKSVHVASARGDHAREAVKILRQKLPVEDYSAIVVFFSPDYDPAQIAAAMNEGFPGAPGKPSFMAAAICAGS